jgi:hypothetical protein
MTKIILSSYAGLLLLFLFTTSWGKLYGNDPGWKAGVAKVIITPEQSMWMAGYGFRDHPSEGKLDDLWAKALALEDADGKKVVLVTSDIVGFSKIMSDNIRDRLASKFGLSRSQILLNSSHTHSGPEVDLEKFKWRSIHADAEQIKRIEQYNKKLENQIVTIVGEALSSLQPVQLYAQNGITRFQVNRRNNSESSINEMTDLKGPNDYSVPVIKAVNKSGKLLAVAFGYACHATVLNSYLWSGDYPGFAQSELEKSHPGATALFFQCTGGNQNALPRRTVPLAQQYGRELAAAVERVLVEDMRLLEPELSVAYSEIELPFDTLPSREQLLKMEKELTGVPKRWARHMLDVIGNGKSLMNSYPYPVQIWKIGDQPVMILGGEVVVEYSHALKKIFGQHIFVLGYSNDPNCAYIPTPLILKEGGYEGKTSQMGKGLPSVWAPTIENMIIQEVQRLAQISGVPQNKPKNQDE